MRLWLVNTSWDGAPEIEGHNAPYSLCEVPVTLLYPRAVPRILLAWQLYAPKSEELRSLNFNDQVDDFTVINTLSVSNIFTEFLNQVTWNQGFISQPFCSFIYNFKICFICIYEYCKAYILIVLAIYQQLQQFIVYLGWRVSMNYAVNFHRNLLIDKPPLLIHLDLRRI